MKVVRNGIFSPINKEAFLSVLGNSEIESKRNKIIIRLTGIEKDTKIRKRKANLYSINE